MLKLEQYNDGDYAPAFVIADYLGIEPITLWYFIRNRLGPISFADLGEEFGLDDHFRVEKAKAFKGWVRFEASQQQCEQMAAAVRTFHEAYGPKRELPGTGLTSRGFLILIMSQPSIPSKS